MCFHNQEQLFSTPFQDVSDSKLSQCFSSDNTTCLAHNFGQMSKTDTCQGIIFKGRAAFFGSDKACFSLQSRHEGMSLPSTQEVLLTI